MIRVVVVDDSAFNRVTLEKLLRTAADIEVVGTARDGFDAIRQIRVLQPDVVTLDLEMPGLDGLGVLRWIQADAPVPVVVVTSRESNQSLFQALRLGAVDFVLKPGRVSPRLPVVGDELQRKIRRLGGGRGDRAAVRARDLAVGPARPPTAAPGCIVLAASTGGPPALHRVVGSLPADLPAAVLIVQHMPPASTGMFARRLDDSCPLPVREATSGAELTPGQVLVAPGGLQMTVAAVDGAWRAGLRPGQTEDQHRPSADVLMLSVARLCGAAAAGVVLTGMGGDGTRGLAAIRAAGGLTVAESSDTAVVFGMPRQAIEAGVVDRVLDLDAIPGEVARWAKSLRERSTGTAPRCGPALEAR